MFGVDLWNFKKKWIKEQVRKAQRNWAFFLLIFILIGSFKSRKLLPGSNSDIFTYNQLYCSKEQLRITDLKATGDSLIIVFGGDLIKNENLFELFSNNTLLIKQRAHFLKIRPPASSGR